MTMGTDSMTCGVLACGFDQILVSAPRETAGDEYCPDMYKEAEQGTTQEAISLA